MIYRTLTGSTPLTVFIIILIALGIWFPAFLTVHELSSRDTAGLMPLYSLVISALGQKVILSRILAFLLTILAAFLLVRLNARFVLIQQRNFLPALFFILIAGHSFDLLQINPVLFGALFIIAVVEILFRSYRDEPDSYRFFEAGLMLGIGSLFYAPMIWMISFIWIAIMVQRPFRWREYFYPLLGLLLPIAFTAALLFLADKSIANFLVTLRSNFLWISVGPGLNWTHWAFAGYLALMILVASIFLLKVFQFRKIYVRDYFMVLFWLFVTGSMVFLLLSGFNREMSCIIAIPVSFILTNYFINAKKNVGNKLLLYILLAFMAFMTINNFLDYSKQ